MKTHDVLILVKTYPEYSAKYTETVCTAGILAENKQLIRLYPIRYRYLEGSNQFSKYQWINVKLSKSASDSRPESYKIYENSIKIGEKIDTGTNWNERCKWVLYEKNLYSSVENLYETQESFGTSLGLVKLKELSRFHVELKPEGDIEQAKKKKEAIMKTVLYTIGYEGINQKEFLNRLKQNNISVVADVRHLPLSRKKVFSKTSLSEFLAGKNIDYVNYRQLGADKKLRDKLKKDGDYNTFFKAMTRSVLNHREQLEEINRMICDGKNVALMCFERDYTLCHRMIVARGVKKINGNGLKIKHLTT